MSSYFSSFEDSHKHLCFGEERNRKARKAMQISPARDSKDSEVEDSTAVSYAAPHEERLELNSVHEKTWSFQAPSRQRATRNPRVTGLWGRSIRSQSKASVDAWRNLSFRNQNVAGVQGDVPKQEETECELQGALQEISRLRDELESAVRARDRSYAQLQEAIQSRNEANEGRQQLVCMLENDVCRRNGRSNDGFPDGTQIEEQFRSSQESFEECIKEILNSDTPPTIATILHAVLVPCFEKATAYAHQLVATKKHHLYEFFNDSSNPFDHPNKLVNIMVLSHMQRFVVEWTRATSLEQFQHACETDPDPLLCSWNELGHSSADMVVGIMKSCFDLKLYCDFSSPACYIWPPIGSTVAYKRAKQTQFLNSTLRTRGKSGDTVVVVFPGLYYECPETNSDAEPVVKPIVVLLDTEE